ncbi:MAG: serine--tRNA ligase [Desulfovibrionaceae bacterium]|nr:serine--tRNA ligase [Desulfovibrionaceae bacterium]
MLDLKLLQSNPEVVENALKNRQSNLDMNEFAELDKKRRSILTDLEALQSERNKASGEVARLKREGVDASELLERLGEISAKIKTLDKQADEIKQQVQDWVLGVPNIPDQSVPVGASEDENQEVVRWGEPTKFAFEPKDHVDLGAALGGLDFERAGRLAGARFAVYWDWAAALERAIINFFLDQQTRVNGHIEILPPILANRKTLTGTGNLPKFEADLFHVPEWDYFLIPTAEVPLTNLHADEIIPEEALPLLYTAYTPCFRSEAGSYGKDTRGLIRLHQFNKVEMVHFAHPDKSFEQLETMRGFAEKLLQDLEIPYRVVCLCTGDMGFSSAKTYDLEVWLPGQNKYREISSCSNCTDFQARRANIRFKPKGGGKTAFVHTLNGSGLAVGRTLVAVVENYQQEDGSILVPKVLQPYMHGRTRIEPFKGAV